MGCALHSDPVNFRMVAVRFKRDESKHLEECLAQSKWSVNVNYQLQQQGQEILFVQVCDHGLSPNVFIILTLQTRISLLHILHIL